MSRGGLALAWLALAWLGGVATAQDGNVIDVSSGVVAFSITAENLEDAAACPGCTYVYPDAGTAIVFDVLRQNPNRFYTIDALHTGWQPAAALGLQARYTVTNQRGNVEFLVTPWLALSQVPTLVFTQANVQRENRVRVTVEYRLAITGTEPAGTYATRMAHRVRENGRAVWHDVSATIPAFLTLRLVGVAPSSANAFTIAFAYGLDARSYMTAITTGTPLEATASDLLRAEISTNHPSGYTVTLTVEEVFVPTGGAALRGRVLLGDAAADGRTFWSGETTDGFVPLFEGADYALRVTGDEPPGDYLFTVRLDAVRNP